MSCFLSHSVIVAFTVLHVAVDKGKNIAPLPPLPEQKVKKKRKRKTYIHTRLGSAWYLLVVSRKMIISLLYWPLLSTVNSSVSVEEVNLSGLFLLVAIKWVSDK